MVAEKKRGEKRNVDRGCKEKQRQRGTEGEKRIRNSQGQIEQWQIETERNRGSKEK
jgi:hypothetical protein